MKTSIVALILAAILFHQELKSQVPENYEITIDGEKYSISLGKEYKIQLKQGKVIQVMVNKKEILDFIDNFISFKHKSDLTVATSDLGDGITQTMTSTALGTLILIQEYSTLNPSSMIDLMLQELTKEEVDYGYTMQPSQISQKLNDGTILTGKKATMKYKDEEKYYTVLAFGKRDSGILIVTCIDKNNIEAEQSIIDMLWESLSIKF